MATKLLDSYWPARFLLAVTILMWVWGIFHPDDLGFAVALGIFTWVLYEERAAERRRTAPERARRYSRNLELTWLAQMGAEDYLRRTLIADLRKAQGPTSGASDDRRDAQRKGCTMSERTQVEEYEVSDRGFYGKRLKTDYGDIVEVQESSSASKEAMWLRIRGEAHVEEGAEVKNHVGTRIVKASLSAHCTLGQVLAIRRSIDWWLDNHNNPSYEEVAALEEKLGPWVEFFTEIEGCEPGDAIRSLFDAIPVLSSAQEFGLCYMLLDWLRHYFLNAKQDGWWEDMIERADHDYERNMKNYSEEKQAELRERIKKPSEHQAELPSLD